MGEEQGGFSPATHNALSRGENAHPGYKQIEEAPSKNRSTLRVSAPRRCEECRPGRGPGIPGDPFLFALSVSVCLELL